MQLNSLESGFLAIRVLLALQLAWSAMPVCLADNLPPPSPEPKTAPDFRAVSRHLNPAQIDDLLRQGMAKELQGDRQTATGIFHHVLSIDPGNANAYFNLGVLEEKQGNLQGALYHYRRAAEINPQESDFKQAVVSVQSMLAPVLTVHSGPPAALLPTSETRPVNAVSVNPNGLSPGVPQAAGEQPSSSKRAGVKRAVLGAMFAVGVSAAMGAATGRGMGGLHCPMCRIMRGGF